VPSFAPFGLRPTLRENDRRAVHRIGNELISPYWQETPMTHIDITSFVQHLKDRRVAKAYSYEDLAVATGLTIEELTAAESGNVSDRYVTRIENALR
jgi:hypothetical protein